MSTPNSPYRSDVDALRERLEILQRELGQLRQHTTQLEAMKAREAELSRELADVERRLHAGGAKRGLPMLDQVRVASPCNAKWDEMVGDERVRFCLSCEKNVYNLSAMPREQAEALLAERLGGELCVRFYQRADGTILTQDCPVGATKKRRKKLALAVAGAGAMAVAAFTAFHKETCRGGGQVQGAIAYQPTDDVRPTMGEAIAEPPPGVPSVMGSIAPPPPQPKEPPHVMGRMVAPHPKAPAKR